MSLEVHIKTSVLLTLKKKKYIHVALWSAQYNCWKKLTHQLRTLGGGCST